MERSQDPFNKSVVVYTDNYLQSHSKTVEKERSLSKLLQQQEKEKLKLFLTTQMQARNKRQKTEFFKEKKEDWELQQKRIQDYDHKHAIKMARINQMLTDQKLYNTSEILRKNQERTITFLKPSKDKIRKMMSEQRRNYILTTCSNPQCKRIFTFVIKEDYGFK